jgi:hypothetical protein
MGCLYSGIFRAGQLDYDIALDLSAYIKEEHKYVPWKAFMTNIGFLDTMLSTQDSYGKFQVKDIFQRKLLLHACTEWTIL